MDPIWINVWSHGRKFQHEFFLTKKNQPLIHNPKVHLEFRSRSDDYKSDLIHQFSQDVLPHFDNKTLKPIIDTLSEVNWDDENAHLKVPYSNSSKRLMA